MTKLPSHWSCLPVGELCGPVEKVDPGSLGRDVFMYVDIGALEPSSSSLENVIQIPTTNAPGRARQLIRHGDSIFATVRPYMKKVAFIPKEFDGEIASTGFCVLRPIQEKLHSKFLFYFLQGDQLLDQVLPLQRGVSYPAIRDNDLKNALIPFPPIDEQHRIIELLEDHLSRLDVALTDVKQARIKSAQFRQSLLNSVFYGRKFQSVSLDTCIELIMGQAPPGITCNKNGEGTPFVKVGEFGKLYPTIEEWTHKPLRLAKKGDVLICVVGATVGQINLGIDCAIGRSVAAIRPKNTLLQKYLYYFLELKMLEIRGQSKGSAQGVITKDYINSIQIPLPELKVQQNVLDLLELNFSQIEKSIEVSNIIEHESLSLRRSLLQSAFTGQLAKEVASV